MGLGVILTQKISTPTIIPILGTQITSHAASTIKNSTLASHLWEYKLPNQGTQSILGNMNTNQQGIGNNGLSIAMCINEGYPPNCYFGKQGVIIPKPLAKGTQLLISYDYSSWKYIRKMMDYTVHSPAQDDDIDFGEKPKTTDLPAIIAEWQAIADTMPERFTTYATSNPTTKKHMENVAIKTLNELATNTHITVTPQGHCTLARTHIQPNTLIGTVHGQYVHESTLAPLLGTTSTHFIWRIRTQDGLMGVNTEDPRGATSTRWCARTRDINITNARISTHNDILQIQATKSISKGDLIIIHDVSIRPTSSAPTLHHTKDKLLIGGGNPPDHWEDLDHMLDQEQSLNEHMAHSLDEHEIELQEQNATYNQWDSIWQHAQTLGITSLTEQGFDSTTYTLLRAIKKAWEQKRRNTTSTHTITLQLLCQTHFSLHQQEHLSLLTAHDTDIWRATDAVDHSMGAILLGQVAYLTNQYTWFHPTNPSQNKLDIANAIEACKSAEKDTRIVMTIDAPLTNTLPPIYLTPNAGSNIRIRTLATIPESTLDMTTYDWSDESHTEHNQNALSLILIESGETMPIQWEDFHKELQEKLPHIIPNTNTTSATIESDHRHQPITKTYTLKRKYAYPGLEHLHPISPLFDHMSRLDMANRLLNLLGIHEPPLKKQLLTQGHEETIHTTHHIHTIKSLTLNATKKAFERNRQLTKKHYRHYHKKATKFNKLADRGLALKNDLLSLFKRPHKPPPPPHPPP